MSAQPIIGIMGGGSASPRDTARAEALGLAIANAGWILLNGGRNAGIMEASAKGAAKASGIVVGILPDTDLSRCAEGVTIPIRTGLGDGRNLINILSSDVVVAFQGGAGTVSEVALALKNSRPVLLFDFHPGDWIFSYKENQDWFSVSSVAQAISRIQQILIPSA